MVGALPRGVRVRLSSRGRSLPAHGRVVAGQPAAAAQEVAVAHREVQACKAGVSSYKLVITAAAGNSGRLAKTEELYASIACAQQSRLKRTASKPNQS